MLDFYDDREGVILKEKLGQEELKRLTENGHILSVKEAAALPDYLYALVLTTDDGTKRKYARNDRENTLVSSIYFMENWRNLPAEAVKTAAENLVEACDWYDIEVPAQLKKLAVGLLGVGFGVPWVKDIAAKGEKKRQRYLRAAGMPQRVVNPDLALQKVSSPYVEDSLGLTAETAIDADLAGVMAPTIKLASIDDLDRGIDAYEQNSWGWAPEQKVEFCRPVVKFASSIGRSPDLPEEMRRYGNTKEASPEYTSSMLDTREECFATAEEYMGYLQKLAAVTQDVTGDALAQKIARLEREEGIDQYWGYEVPDPWLAVYGIYKSADDDANYVFNDGGVTVTEPDLRKLLLHHRGRLLDKFDQEFVNAFAEDPIAIFDSLPLDLKRMIAKIKNEINKKNP